MEVFEKMDKDLKEFEDLISKDKLLDIRVNTKIVKELMFGFKDVEELNNIDHKDYVPIVFLAFEDDTVFFFLFRQHTDIEEYKKYILTQLDFGDLAVTGNILRIILVRCIYVIFCYLNARFNIPMDFKRALLSFIKKMLETYMVYFGTDEILISVSKTYKSFYAYYGDEGEGENGK